MSGGTELRGHEDTKKWVHHVGRRGNGIYFGVGLRALEGMCGT